MVARSQVAEDCYSKTAYMATGFIEQGIQDPAGGKIPILTFDAVGNRTWYPPILHRTLNPLSQWYVPYRTARQEINDRSEDVSLTSDLSKNSEYICDYSAMIKIRA